MQPEKKIFYGIFSRLDAYTAMTSNSFSVLDDFSISRLSLFLRISIFNLYTLTTLLEL